MMLRQIRSQVLFRGLGVGMSRAELVVAFGRQFTQFLRRPVCSARVLRRSTMIDRCWAISWL